MVIGEIMSSDNTRGHALEKDTADTLSPPLMASPCPANSVAVVIPTYNHAHFLADSIESVKAQTWPAHEIIVVDDGSQDDPEAITRQYEDVRLIRRKHGGLAAARNTGLYAAHSGKIIFLDADDLLRPRAIESGLAAFARAPGAGFVYGAHSRLDARGRPLVAYSYSPIGSEPYRDFLVCNKVGMHAAVIYDREKLVSIGGFNEVLHRCEDYDAYLRLSKVAPIASHAELVADYRWHGKNMSTNHRQMLAWVLRVHRQELAHALKRPETTRDWLKGRKVWRTYYAGQILDALSREAELKDYVRGFLGAAVASPSVTVLHVAKSGIRILKKWVPPVLRQRVKRLFGKSRMPAVGAVDFGDFHGTRPISSDFGFERGTPIDRYYIGKFLSAHAADIKGRALEVGDAAYCARYGAGKITSQDVLHVSSGAPGATIVGDLSQSGVLPEGAFDCLLLTQTLHLVYDMRAAVTEMHGALRPNGVVLLTFPGISQLDRGEWGKTWYWALTQHSAHRMFAEIFGSQNVVVEAYGNVFAATAFLQGLALEEVDCAKLDDYDEAYPVTIAVRAWKAASA
jgi:glycosyltransferase involved in cell wall biosynthesis/SAM-dependent methyltransferase